MNDVHKGYNFVFYFLNYEDTHNSYLQRFSPVGKKKTLPVVSNIGDT